jgi:hypothetical protein
MAAHPVAILDMIARIKQLEEALRKIARMTDCDHRGAHEEVGCPMGIIRTALENSSD